MDIEKAVKYIKNSVVSCLRQFDELFSYLDKMFVFAS